MDDSDTVVIGAFHRLIVVTATLIFWSISLAMHVVTILAIYLHSEWRTRAGLLIMISVAANDILQCISSLLEAITAAVAPFGVYIVLINSVAARSGNTSWVVSQRHINNLKGRSWRRIHLNSERV